MNTERPDILRAKRAYGFWFGVALGFGFSIFTWGIDSYTLSNHHGLYPWIKFAVGSVLCSGIGGVAGWLTARVNKSIHALVFWLVAASAFAWLTINIPLRFVPQILSVIEPATSGLLHYTYYPELGSRLSVAYTWIAIFIAIASLLQIPMSESAVFSSSFMGRLAPMIVSVVLMSICGMIVDTSLINEPLRSAMIATDDTIQFVVDNRGKDVDPAESRKMHAGAFRAIQDVVTQQRKLIVSGYDKYLGEVNVLIQFDTGWVECQIFYNQPGSCKMVKGLE